MSYRSSYSYQIRCKDGTLGYVGQYRGKYVFTPITYDEFPAAMLMAKALNKRTINEHEVYCVKKRVHPNGRYGPMRQTAVAPVRGDEYERPTSRNEVPPEISQEDYEARDAVSPTYERDAPAGPETADYAEEYANRILGRRSPHTFTPREERRAAEEEEDSVELCY